MTGMNKNDTHHAFSESDLAALVDLHKFYLELLIKGAAFSATAQGALIAIGGGNLSDTLHIRLVAFGVQLISVVAVALFLFSMAKLIELDDWVKAAFEQHQKPWRPHTEVLPRLAWTGAYLNAASLLAATTAFAFPSLFATGAS